MEMDVLNILENNKIENDINFPYWLYQSESVYVSGKRFIKAYLFNREFNDKKLDLIVFKYGETEYQVSTLNAISKYNNSNIVGAAFEIPIEDSDTNLLILKEVVNGENYTSSRNNVLYVKNLFPKENDYLIEKSTNYKLHHDVYPQITDKCWQCSCGRIHSLDASYCDCGLSKDDVKEIIDFNFEDSHIGDAINGGITYDLNKTFNENIDIFKNNFTSKFKDCDVEKLISRVNLEDEENKYNQLVAEKANKKKKRKKGIIITAIIAFLIVCGISCFCYFSPDYSEYIRLSFFENDIQKKYKGFYELDVLDSKEKSFNYFKSYIKELYEQQEYNEIYNSVTHGSKYCSVDSWSDIKDEEIMKIFEESVYEKAKEHKDNIRTLNTMKTYLEELDSEYLDEVCEWIDDYYISKINKMTYGTTDYFYNRYKETYDIKYYKYFLESIHYDICLSGCIFDDYLFSGDSSYGDYGFGSATDFIEELGNYFPSLVDEQCYDEVRLRGYWSGDGYYFEMQEDGHISYNLPWFSYGDYYVLKNHVITTYEDSDKYRANGRDLFKITFKNNNCIRVYCYKDGSSHTLYKS